MTVSASDWTRTHSIVYSVVLPLIVGALLFVPAGRIDWQLGWLFLAVSTVVTIISALWLRRVNPEIFAARRRIQPGTKGWDFVVLNILFAAIFAVFVVAGMDAGRYRWSDLAWPTVVAGYFLYLSGFAGMTWAQGVNRHFEPGVRIQADRSHHVIDTGPYRIVRHPGYAAAILLFVGMALTLGSLWALLPVAVIAVDLIVRTALEDATLQRELPGYLEFTRRTRYRLLPGVW